MPYYYRVTSDMPKVIMSRGGFVGYEGTILPDVIGQTWPIGSFCAADIKNFDGVTRQAAKTALSMFRPGDTTGIPLLYRLNVTVQEVFEHKPIPDYVWQGGANGQAVEVIIKGLVKPEDIEVSVGNGWKKITEF